ncbi:hypothetical protein LDH14_13540, partial [Mycobacterium tuberculosis]
GGVGGNGVDGFDINETTGRDGG